jgi:hypothetical protein
VYIPNYIKGIDTHMPKCVEGVDGVGRLEMDASTRGSEDIKRNKISCVHLSKVCVH